MLRLPRRLAVLIGAALAAKAVGAAVMAACWARPVAAVAAPLPIHPAGVAAKAAGVAMAADAVAEAAHLPLRLLSRRPRLLRPQPFPGQIRRRVLKEVVVAEKAEGEACAEVMAPGAIRTNRSRADHSTRRLCHSRRAG